MSDIDNVRDIPQRRPERPAHPTDYAAEDAKQVANGIQAKRLQEFRTAVRQDAVVIVERARERAGLARTGWTPLDADTLHAITDLLLKIQAQDAPRA